MKKMGQKLETPLSLSLSHSLSMPQTDDVISCNSSGSCTTKLKARTDFSNVCFMLNLHRFNILAIYLHSNFV